MSQAEFSLIDVCVVFAYLSLVIELVRFHVPSVVSNRQLLSNDRHKTFLSPRFMTFFNTRKSVTSTIVMLSLFLVYCAFAYPLLVIFDLISHANDSQWGVASVGVLCVLLGRVLTFSSVLTLRRYQAIEGHADRLHTDSIFAYSRNPGLLGMFLFMLGLLLIYPSFWFSLGVIHYFLYMHIKVLMEEDFLKRKFGHKYCQYQAQTGRYW